MKLMIGILFVSLVFSTGNYFEGTEETKAADTEE